MAAFGVPSRRRWSGCPPSTECACHCSDIRATVRHMPDVFPPLPADWPFDPTTPFTFGQAVTAGVSRSRLRTLVERGAVRRLIASVYVAAPTRDSLPLRLQALSLVVPLDAVVTDESAGWLHGAEMVLAPAGPVTSRP